MKIKSSIFYLIVLILVNIGCSIKENKIKTFSSSNVCLIENYYYSLMTIDTNLAREKKKANMISSFISTRRNSNDLLPIMNNNMNSNVEKDESMIENSTGHHQLAESLAIQNNIIESQLTNCKRKIKRVNGHHLKCFKFEMLEIFIKKCLCLD